MVAAATAFMVLVLVAVSSAQAGVTFSEAYGTFKNPTLAIDGDRSTFAEATGTPYRDEYFLIARFPASSIVRNFKIRFEGKEPKKIVKEMSPDAIAWIAFEPGEKATYVRIRFPAVKGDIFKIAELEANSEVAPEEAFAPTVLEAANIETTTVVINAGFTKPVRLNVSYGLSPSADDLKNFTEYTSYQPFYQIRLTDLIEGLEYYVRIKATTAEGNVYVAEDANMIRFRLRGTPPLKMVNMGVGYVNPLSFSVAIQTNIPAHCVVYFGEPEKFNNIVSRTEFDTRHTFEFKDLLPNHIYSYMAVATDHRGMSLNLGKQVVSTAIVNIAKGKRVIAGSFTELRNPGWQGGGHSIGDTVLQRLTDGKNGFFDGMAHSGNLVTADQWAVIDLGRVYTLDAHTTVWRALAYPYGYELLTSTDNQTWTKQIAMTEPRIAQGQSIRSGSGDPLHVTGSPFPESVRARYVKLLIPRGTKFSKRHAQWTNVDLAEIMIYPGGDYKEIKRIVKEEWRP